MTRKLISIIFGASALLLIGSANAKISDQTFACHVATDSNIDGLVFIQVESKDEAATRAVGSKARTLEDKRAKAILVKECVKHPKGKFSDRDIQEFYDNLPM